MISTELLYCSCQLWTIWFLFELCLWCLCIQIWFWQFTIW